MLRGYSLRHSIRAAVAGGSFRARLVIEAIRHGDLRSIGLLPVRPLVFIITALSP
jgi:hypothetical protein